MREVELRFSSLLAAPPERVWSWITSMRGVSKELAPLLRMTAPAGVEDLASVSVEPGRPLFRSWILLFGVIPVDRSDLTLIRLDTGKGFVEESPMLSMRRWKHERYLSPERGGTRLTDRLLFEPRLATAVTRWFIRVVFRHRHRVLQRTLGSLD